MLPLGLRALFFSLLLAGPGLVDGARRRFPTKRPACMWDSNKSTFKFRTPKTLYLKKTDAWAPRGNKLVLTNDCQYWLNTNCSIIQKINGCDDGNACTQDRCRATKPASCSPFPKCAYFPATCTYQKTCDTPATKANKILDGNHRVPAPKAACTWIAEKKTFHRVDNWPFWKKLKRYNAWAPSPGKHTRTGDCRYILDDQCSIVFNTGGCDDGNECTRDWCKWHGNVNTVRGCTPFPTCFYRAGMCMHTKIAGCGKKKPHGGKGNGGKPQGDPNIGPKVQGTQEDGGSKGQGQSQNHDGGNGDNQASTPAPPPENHGSSNSNKDNKDNSNSNNNNNNDNNNNSNNNNENTNNNDNNNSNNNNNSKDNNNSNNNNDNNNNNNSNNNNSNNNRNADNKGSSNGGGQQSDGGSKSSNSGGSKPSNSAIRTFAASSSYSQPTSSLPAYNVLDNGAAGDGSSWDTQAIQALLLRVCAEGRGDNQRRTVLFPAGHTFRTGPLILDENNNLGGCGDGGLEVQIEGTIIGSNDCNDYHSLVDGMSAVLVLSHMKNLRVLGQGTIDGNGDRWWNPRLNGCDKPQGLSVRYCNTCSVEGITIRHPGQMHLIMHQCTNIMVDGVNTDSPEDSPNTDSIHLEFITGGTIQNCNLKGGDDAISIVTGTSNVQISNIQAEGTHGFSIGSLGMGGITGCVSGVSFENLSIQNALFGVRIKTYEGGKGSVHGISFSGVSMTNVARPIVIDQSYCNSDASHHCASSQPYNIAVSDITFNDIHGSMDPTSDTPAVYFDCSEHAPCDQLKLGNIALTGSHYTPLISYAIVSTTGPVSPSLPDSNISGISGSQQAKIKAMQSQCPN